MTKHILTANLRSTTGRAVKKLRAEGLVPGNVFGKEAISANIQLGERDLSHLIKGVGESALIYLQVAQEPTERPVMISELKRHPVTGQLQHVAFHQVNLKQKVTTSVPVALTGEAPAVAEKLGILVQQLTEVEIEALPTDVPEKLEVDVSALAEVDAAVLVKDIKVSSQVEVNTDPETLVAKIEPLAAEEPVEVAPVVEGEVPPVEGEAPASDQSAEEVKVEEKPAQ